MPSWLHSTPWDSRFGILQVPTAFPTPSMPGHPPKGLVRGSMLPAWSPIRRRAGPIHAALRPKHWGRCCHPIPSTPSRARRRSRKPFRSPSSLPNSRGADHDLPSRVSISPRPAWRRRRSVRLELHASLCPGGRGPGSAFRGHHPARRTRWPDGRAADRRSVLQGTPPVHCVVHGRSASGSQAGRILRPGPVDAELCAALSRQSGRCRACVRHGLWRSLAFRRPGRPGIGLPFARTRGVRLAQSPARDLAKGRKSAGRRGRAGGRRECTACHSRQGARPWLGACHAQAGGRASCRNA